MPKTLLLADDSVTIQKVVGITFANEDVRLITESNGDAALARAREDAPDLVLADVAMPGLNGYELCAAIKADPRLSQVPVILLTGTFESYDESRTAEVGADGHISKPFEAQALVDLVHRTLERVARGERAPRPQAQAPAAPEPLELEPEMEAPAPAPQPPAQQPPAPAPQPAQAPQPPGPQVQPPQPQAPQAPMPQARPPAQQPAQPASAQPQPTPQPARPQPQAPPAPEPAPQARREMDFSFSDFGQDLSAPPPQPSGEVTQFYDPLAERAGPPVPPKDSPATVPPADQPNPMFEETSFLDPRAPEPPAQPTPPPAAAPAPPAAPDVPEIEAPASSSNPLAASAAPELDVFEAPDVPSLRTPSEDRSQTTGETTWQLTETPSQPTSEPSAAALAAERALDELPGSERVVHASPDETSSEIAWAEPIEDDGAPSRSKEAPDAEAVREAASFGPATLAGLNRPPVQVDSKQLQDALEKLAWEAFGPVSEQLVGEALKKIEEVAWEVIPQIAERLVREEIAKLKKG